MVWFLLLHLGMFLVDLVAVTHRTNRDKDVEILLPRHQPRLVQQERPRSPRLSRWEKLTLAVLTAKLMGVSARATPGRRPWRRARQAPASGQSWRRDQAGCRPRSRAALASRRRR